MRLRSRKRERPLSSKSNLRKVTKLKKKPLNKPLSKSPSNWRNLIKREAAKNALPETPQFCITRSQKNLKTRPVRTRAPKSMEKPVEVKPKLKFKEERVKKPIFQTVVRNTPKETVTSSTSVKKAPVTTSKVKDIKMTKSAQLRQSSLNRDVRKTEVISSAISSPRKTRRIDHTKSVSLNNSPIRKVRQIGLTNTKATVSSTNESPKKKTKKTPVTEQCFDDNDVTMYEPHTTTLIDFPTPNSQESDSENVESSELCLPNDCLNEFMAIAECAQLINNDLPNTDETINLLADKAAKVMTTEKCEEKSRTNSVDKRSKRRKSSNDLEMYQPTSTTDDLDNCTEFLTNGEKYVQVSGIT